MYVAWASPEVWRLAMPDHLPAPSTSARDGALVEEIVGFDSAGDPGWRIFWPRPLNGAALLRYRPRRRQAGGVLRRGGEG